jgi:hypothetical protein
VYDNQSTYPTTLAEDIEATAEGVIDDSIDLAGWTIHLDADFGGACPGDVGCTVIKTRSMFAPFPSADQLVADGEDRFPQGLINSTIAGIFCHELMHVWLHETGQGDYGDCDPATHSTCPPFDFTQDPTSVCSKVAGEFD